MTEPERPVADWPQDEPWAKVAETHAAVVFLAADRACKLKKPVNLGFLDFSTVEARAAACAREVELNRKFAPDVYLGVAEIRGPDGRVCDHLVVMHRMPAARRLSTLVRSRAPVAGPLRQVARIIAAQHAKAARSPHITEQGSRDALRRRWADNIDQTRKIQARLAPREPLHPAVIAAYRPCRYAAWHAQIRRISSAASRPSRYYPWHQTGYRPRADRRAGGRHGGGTNLAGKRHPTVRRG